LALFKNKYRVDSARLKDWDYSIPWWYYVTICTKDMRCCFGEIINGEMMLNEYGNYAFSFFKDIPNHFKCVEIDYFVIMPNHVHGIVIINDLVETRDRVSLLNNRKFGNPLKNSLPVIINQYKGSVTRFIRKSGFPSFQWQSRFYDHIIRNEKDLDRIRMYIKYNPLKWEVDEYYEM
jgi:putative transposase